MRTLSAVEPIKEYEAGIVRSSLSLKEINHGPGQIGLQSSPVLYPQLDAIVGV
jgi:hypothetical protein